MLSKPIRLLLLAVLLLPSSARSQSGTRRPHIVRLPVVGPIGGDSIDSILRQADALPDPIHGTTKASVEPDHSIGSSPTAYSKQGSPEERAYQSKYETLETSGYPSPNRFDVRNPVDVEIAEPHIAESIEFGHPLTEQSFVDRNATSSNLHGYDGLVDSYVQDLLINGGSPASCLPCTSLLAPPIPTVRMPCAPSLGVTGWYVQAQSLILQPWGQERVDTTVTNATGETALSTDALHQDWASGVDARIGFRTGYSAIEFGWWSLFADSDQTTTTSTAGDLFSVINFIELDVDFNNAQLHRLESEFEVHTFELNKRHLLAGWNAGELRFAYMWGARFTRLSDELRFLADTENTHLGDATGETAYEIEVDNRLFGPQIGGTIQWQLNERLSFMLDAKAGIFYNNIDQMQSASSSVGPANIIAGPDIGRPFGIDQNDHQASVLTELQINLDYTLTQRTRLLLGYRAFAASGVALSRSQVPWRFGSVNAANTDASDSLMLHGFQIGLDASF